MSQHAHDQFLRAVVVAAWTSAVFALIALVTDGAVGDFVGVALVGGLLLAGLLFAINRRSAPPVVTHDSFAGMTSSEMLNIAHVRVAGVGGLALVAFCVIVASQFALTAAAVTAGLIGGMATGWMLIRRRRHARRATA